jgi:hypothetical protein
MPTDPLSLWQVLKEEYESYHGPLYFYLKYPGKLAAALTHSPTPLSSYLLSHLSERAQRELARHRDSDPFPEGLQNELTDLLNALLTDRTLYLHYLPGATASFDSILTRAGVKRTTAELSGQPLPDDAALVRINRLLLDAAYPDVFSELQTGDLKEMYSIIRPRKHSALCLSGGGVRSATFNLGILQGLARHRLLEKFDYLSTVSGGGYVGGWLSAWIQRQGLDRVVAQLSQPPLSPIDPEPKQLVHLRTFSNYLSPRLGLLGADTWTMISTLVRNIILNWLVLIPILIALLIFPRMWLSFLYGHALDDAARAFHATVGFPLSLVIGFVADVIALTYIGLNLPSTGRIKQGRRRLLWSPLLLPLLISAMAFATFWARDESRLAVSWKAVVIYAELLLVIPLIVSFGYRLMKTRHKLGVAWQIIGATLLIVAAQFIAGSLAWVGATAIYFFADPREHIILFSCFALPLLLGLLMLAGTLISGLTSRYTEDDDQEWWSRSGSLIYIVSLAWIVICVLVLYGPYLFVWLSDWRTNGQFWIARIGTLAGIISGAISLVGGFSGKTPANEQEAQKAGASSIALGALTSMLGPIFLAFIFILLSYIGGWLLTLSQYLPETLRVWLNVPAGMPASAIEHVQILLHSPLRLLVLLFLLLAALGLLMGRAINTNKFSLHYFWRNRIIRAYLGASHDARQPNPFTGFDTNDNVYMHELRPFQPGSPVPPEEKPPHRERKLFHVLNIALNLAGSSRLAWQERKAESFTVSPLHAGNYMLGYRKSSEYGRQPYNGKQGISLGTAVAISGAFASPNMGYMMSSPVVRFLLTLFNVRFGWWLGNPGRAGDDGLPFGRTFDRDSPRLSVTPIFQEALGMTDDEAGYVYLSDGGHFENYGLYEMVLRRCNTIVVGDGSSDADYTFQSLGLAIRQIRIDLGVPIVFKDFHITGRPLKGEGTDSKMKNEGVYCAIGEIRYSCVDGGGKETDGALIIIKPALVGGEPRDVLNYASEHGSFPQEFIGDQWFSESQFESYRALGSHIVDAISRQGEEMEDHNAFADLAAFRSNLEAKLGQISLTNFEQKLLDNLNAIPKSINRALEHLEATGTKGSIKPTGSTNKPPGDDA